MRIKAEMFNYIDYCIQFTTKVRLIMNRGSVLRLLRASDDSTLLGRTELEQVRSLCKCCWNMLKWLTQINFEKNASEFGIDDYFSFKCTICDQYETLGFMIEYCDMCLQRKLSKEERVRLEEIANCDSFRNAFCDVRSDLGDRSMEYILTAPVKRVNYLNKYIEVGRNCIISDGIKSGNLKNTEEYKKFIETKTLDSLGDLVDTGKLDPLFSGCIAIEDFEPYLEIAITDVNLRGMDAHYCCWKMYCNRDKYKKIIAAAEPNTFFIIYSSFDKIDGDLMCEYGGMDIELGKRVNNCLGIYRGKSEDRKFSYDFIVDTNPS